MIKKISLLIVILSSFSTTYSQESTEAIPFIDTKEILNKVSLAAQVNDFDGVIEEINKVNPKDSSYCDLLSTKSYYLIQSKNFDEALEVIEEGLSSECSVADNATLYLNKGFILSEQDKAQTAANIYKEALKKYPKNAKMLNNLGRIYLDYDEKDTSFKYLQQAVKNSPALGNAHLNIARLMYESGETSWSTMAMIMAIFVQPEAEYAMERLGILEETLSSKNKEYNNKKELTYSENLNSLNKLDVILDNQIALNKNYEIKHPLKFNYVKQIHALFTELQNTDPKGNDLLKNLYYDFFTWVDENDHFDELIFAISLNVNDKDTQRAIEKKQRKIKKFYQAAIKKYYELLQNSDASIKNEDDFARVYFYDNGMLSGRSFKKNEEINGYTEFYDTNGRIISEGMMKNGDRVGAWKFYNLDGDLKEINHFKNGKTEGLITSYWKTGKKRFEYHNISGKTEGEYKEYNPYGALIDFRNYKANQQVGKQFSYYQLGKDYPYIVAQVENNKLEGNFKELYPDGSLQRETNFKNGELHGIEKYYYFNGELAQESNYVEGKLHGKQTSYHFNGQISEIGEYEENEYSGEWKSFNKKGELTALVNYKNNEIDGEYIKYHKEEPIEIMEFRRGKLKEFKAYDTEGNLLAETKKRKGRVYYKSFTPQGVLVMEGEYDVKGGKTGIWKEYHKNGNLESKGMYEEGSPVGEFKFYYKDGKTLSEVRGYNSEGKLHGINQYFYPNGQISKQGWYQNNEKHGKWLSYYSNGNLKADEFYKNGKQQTTLEVYAPNKALYNQQKIYNDWVVSNTYYKPDGKALDTVNFINDDKEFTLKYNSLYGEYDFVCEMTNGIRNGKFSTYHFNDQVKSEGKHLNAELHGEINYYDVDGNLIKTENYVYGDLFGTVKTFHKDSSIKTEYFFENDQAEGDYKEFYSNGNLREEGTYENGNLVGEVKMYSKSGTLEILVNYINGIPTSYAYLDENNKLIQPIEINSNTIVEAFFPNGNTSRKFTYKNAVLDGKYVIYSENGKPYSIYEYQNGFLTGELTHYYEDGQIKKQGKLDFGNWQGEVTSYYKNGEIKRTENYIDDIKTGTSKFYKEDGSLKETRKYFNDEIYEIEKA